MMGKLFQIIFGVAFYGFLAVIIYGCMAVGKISREEYEKNAVKIHGEITAKINASEHKEARAIINKYIDVGGDELKKLERDNDSKHIQKIEAELASLKQADHKKRIDLYDELTGFAAGRTPEREKARDIARADYERFRMTNVIYEEDCESGQAKSLAHIMLQKWVNKELLAPASAKYPWRNEIDITVSKPCEFLINGYVDSQNQYGAMLRTRYVGKLQRDLTNKDRFILKSLRFVE